MRSDRLLLHDAIHARWEDDLPRLVFCDWLEEHGEDERAEYIRLSLGAVTTETLDRMTSLVQSAVFNPLAVPYELYAPWSDGFRLLDRQAGPGASVSMQRGMVHYIIANLRPMMNILPRMILREPPLTVDIFGATAVRDRHGSFSWYPGFTSAHNGSIPPGIFRLLDQHEPARDNRWPTYRNQTLARDALGRAVVAWSKVVAAEEGLT